MKKSNWKLSQKKDYNYPQIKENYLFEHRRLEMVGVIECRSISKCLLF